METISQRGSEESATNGDGHSAVNKWMRMPAKLLPNILPLDARSESIQKKISERKSICGPTYVERLVASKSDIERQLLQNDQKCKQLYEAGVDVLTNAIAANEDRELRRRKTNAERFQNLTEEIREEQTISEGKVEAITEHWSALQNIENPFDLNDALDRQKEKISEVVALKNRSIQLLRDEIDRLYQIFNEYSDRQKRDAQCMCERTVNHLDGMKECIDENLQNVSDVLERQRHRFLTNATLVWDECRSGAEQMENKQEQLKIVQTKKSDLDLRKLRVDIHEALRSGRLELEREKDNFHVHMETVKARSMLKADQMRYNHQVLQMKRSENVITISERRRRLTKVQAAIATLESKIKQLNYKYLKDSSKLRAQITSMETGNDRWQEIVEKRILASVKTYKNLWNMHEKEITQRIRTVCASDQKIFEQILLKKWKNPNGDNGSVTTKAETNEPQSADAFDLEAFVQNFQYLPLDWKSRDNSAVQVQQSMHNERSKDNDRSKPSEFLAQQNVRKVKIFNALSDDDNVMRIPMLNESAIDHYWLQFGQYFNADRKRTWRMLSMALKEYLKLLQLREKLANKCNLQRRRYDELQYFFKNISASNGDDRK